MLETAKMRGQIARLEDRRNELLHDLGSNVYLGYKNGAMDDEFIAEKCEEISAIELDIQKKTEELEAFLAEQQMPATAAEKCECGADIQPGNRFCPHCGRQLEE